MTPPLFQRKKVTIEETTQDFHDRNQKFLRSTQKHSPQKVPSRRDSYIKQSSPSQRHSFKALPAIDDEPETEEESAESETSENGSASHRAPIQPLLGEHFVADVAETNDQLLDRVREVGVECPLNGSRRLDDYNSIANVKLKNPGDEEGNTMYRLSREEALETKLRQLLERDSTRPSEKQQFIKEYMQELHKEHQSLIAQWRSEFDGGNPPPTAPRSQIFIALETMKQQFLKPCIESIFGMLSYAEVFISNLPLTIGAVALAWVTMGVVWFKFMEENTSSCVPVHYNSPLCSFPEFPGCFECDTSNSLYRAALCFHNVCTFFAGILAMTFLLKVIVAWRVVADELSNPTTATPCGVICITLVCVFAGRGWIGEAIVLVTSSFQIFFAFWFLYMAIFAFRILPDPSWFPSTVGLAFAAIKIWLYFPEPGKILLGICITFFFATFFVSVLRVALSPKISAPVCWIQLSAPSITMYAMTIISQPNLSTELSLEADAVRNHAYHETMHEYYMPAQHMMMVLSMVGMISAVHSFWIRWGNFRKIEFSPAHVAFCFPSLSHTNAIQAYRGAVDSFSTIPSGSPFKIALFSYWIAWLVFGTVLNLVFTYKFLRRLPKWCKIDMYGETQPPEPSQTIMHEMLQDAHEVLGQDFVSPAVLQANEAGALVRVRRGTVDFQRYGPYVRTRQVRSLGFDPTMDDDALRVERAKLLDWVAKNAPRTRKRTLSDAMIIQLKDKAGNGIYGSMDIGEGGPRRHARAQTIGSSSDMTNMPWA